MKKLRITIGNKSYDVTVEDLTECFRMITERPARAMRREAYGIAVGNPAEIRPPNEHDEIWAVQETLDFPGTVFGLARPAPGASLMPEMTRRYARALAHHKDDRIIEQAPEEIET